MIVHTWKRAQNIEVVTTKEGARIGALVDFQFDLADGRIYGWRIKGIGMFGKSGGVAAADLTLIGRDVAFVTSEQAVEWTTAGPREVDGRAWASDYRGTSAISRRGRSMGAVQDFVIDETGRQISGLILHGNLLLPLTDEVNMGPAAVIAQRDDQAVEVPDSRNEDQADWWRWLRDSLARSNQGTPPAVPTAAPSKDESTEEGPR